MRFSSSRRSSRARSAARALCRVAAARTMVEGLENRTLLTINLTVVAGGTLDINPISSIFPTTGYDYMAVTLTSSPGTTKGTIAKVSGASVTAWGTTNFGPTTTGTINRVYSGEGLRYVSTAGTPVGTSESIPVRFSNVTGFNQATDTLVITTVAPVGAPAITTQPAPTTSIVKGTTTTLSVTATGNAPLSYQWYRGVSPNGFDPIAGATSRTYTPPATTVAGSYMYWVKVSNSVSSVASNTATVFVGSPATVNTGGPYTVTESGSVTLNATATDPDNGLYLVYSWDFDGDGLYGENTTQFGDERGKNAIFRPNFGIDGPSARTLGLKVTTDKALDTVVSTTVNITNSAPVGQFLGDSTGKVQFVNLKDSPSDLAGMVYQYDFNNDGVWEVVNSTSGSATVPDLYLAGFLAGQPVRGRATDPNGARTADLLAGPGGQVIVVNTTADNNAGTAGYAVDSPNVSLRDAITLAQSNPEPDQIIFAQSILTGFTTSLALTLSPIAAESAFVINTPITITGPRGAQGVALVGKGATANYRAFTVNAAGSLTLENLNLRDFSSYGAGAIGGAIYAKGPLTVRGSAFWNNTAADTVAGTAQRGWGGAIAVENTTATIDNSTFTTNTAGNYTTNIPGAGGAIAAIGGATLTLRNDTISGNKSKLASGVYVLGNSSATSAAITNTILAGNTDATADYYQTVIGSGSVSSTGTNNITGLTAKSATFGGTSVFGNPALGTFGLNGGPTQTMLITPASIAYNAGVAIAALTADQRGSARAIGVPDIGAVEAQLAVSSSPVSATVFVGNTATFKAAAIGTPTPTVQWQLSTNGGQSFANIAGATSTTLNLTNVNGLNGYQYRAVFTSSVGTVTTAAATLTTTTTATFGAGTYTIGRSGGVIVVSGTGGSFTYAASLLTSLTFNGADVTVQNELGPTTGAGTLAFVVGTGTTARFASSQHLGSLNVLGSLAVTATGAVVRTDALAVGAGATLNLNANALLFDYKVAPSPASTVRSLIQTARAGGAWTGTGLTSLSAKNDATGHTTLGFMEASEYKSIYGTTATFAGEVIDDTAVLVKYTTYGDATFDGKTDFNDFLALQNGFGQPNRTSFGGDFDNSGTTDFNDFLLQQNHFGSALPAAAPVAKTALVAATASISGVAFNDANRNGKFDKGDTLAAGKAVWLDLDDDGVKDANEPSALTDAKGQYAFKNLAAGTYHVRRVFASGYSESTKPAVVSLTAGQAAKDVLIGSRVV